MAKSSTIGHQRSGVFAHALTDGAIRVATGQVGEHPATFDESYVAAVLVEAVVIEPVNPCGGDHLDILGGALRLAGFDQFADTSVISDRSRISIRSQGTPESGANIPG
ncbi:hypothetical protein ACVWWN_006757 [Mycobacterium sp. URHB0021]|jgi:hypothetical protein